MSDSDKLNVINKRIGFLWASPLRMETESVDELNALYTLRGHIEHEMLMKRHDELLSKAELKIRDARGVHGNA